MSILDNLHQLVKIIFCSNKYKTIEHGGNVTIGCGNTVNYQYNSEKKHVISLDEQTEKILGCFLKGGRGAYALNETGTVFQVNIYGIIGEDMVELTEQADLIRINILLSNLLIQQNPYTDRKEYIITEKGTQYFNDRNV